LDISQEAFLMKKKDLETLGLFYFSPPSFFFLPPQQSSFSFPDSAKAAFFNYPLSFLNCLKFLG